MDNFIRGIEIKEIFSNNKVRIYFWAVEIINIIQYSRNNDTSCLSYTLYKIKILFTNVEF